MDIKQLEIAIKAVQIFSETHPKPSQGTQTQAAEMLGISRQTVSRMIRTSSFSLNKCGMVSILEIDLILCARNISYKKSCKKFDY